VLSPGTILQMIENVAKGSINVKNIKWSPTKDCLLNRDFLSTINCFQPKNLIIKVLIPKIIKTTSIYENFWG
jgi:hypothetical protein